MSKHSRLPWQLHVEPDRTTILGPNGHHEPTIAVVIHPRACLDPKETPESRARLNAKFIVDACNNHESLVTALEVITHVVGHNSCSDGRQPNGFVVALDRARTALKRLREEGGAS